MTASVVRLGAWCDLASEDETTLVTSFVVGEFAVLDDGRRVVLHADRGWTEQLRGVGTKPTAADLWRFATRADLERSVLDTVLPDDAEDTHQDHPWEWLSGLLRARGIEAPAEELRGLPYDVEFSERLLARIPGGA